MSCGICLLSIHAFGRLDIAILYIASNVYYTWAIVLKNSNIRQFSHFLAEINSQVNFIDQFNHNCSNETILMLREISPASQSSFVAPKLLQTTIAAAAGAVVFVAQWVLQVVVLVVVLCGIKSAGLHHFRHDRLFEGLGLL